MSTGPSGTSFKLRTPAHIKSCHLVGSWDNYGKRYNMSADASGNAGWWSLTLKFGPSMPAKRYWYYYILDGYFESHDPNKPTTLEPTRKITLNILDYNHASSPAPSSATSSSRSSSTSSRFPSPTSSLGTSPISATSSSSKRSAGVWDHAPQHEPYYHSKPLPPTSRRTPSPRRANGHLSTIIAPRPRNPLGQHKLTLDTHAHERPYSMITTAATTAGDSPVSASSSRSNSSIGSFCSSCSGSTWSDPSSPSTPICTCAIHTKGGHCDADYDSYDSESSDESAGRYRVRAERRKTYAPSSSSRRRDEELAYRLERGLRM